MSDTIINGTVTLFKYRDAWVIDPFLQVPRDTVRELEEDLADSVGARRDNHTVYQIQPAGNESPVYIGFSDSAAKFGHTIHQGNI